MAYLRFSVPHLWRDEVKVSRAHHIAHRHLCAGLRGGASRTTGRVPEGVDGVLLAELAQGIRILERRGADGFGESPGGDRAGTALLRVEGDGLEA